MSAEPGPPRGTEPSGRSHGVIALVAERCTSCMACARECPTWCIEIGAHTETVAPTTPRGRARSHHVLDEFTIDMGLCMYCGMCIEVCPFDALHWSAHHSYAATDRDGLRHDRHRLESWARGADDSS